MYTHSLYIRFLMLFFCVFKKGFNLIYSSISIAIHYFCKSSLKYSYFGSFFKSSVSKKKSSISFSYCRCDLEDLADTVESGLKQRYLIFFLLPFLLWKGLDPQVEEASFPLSVS